MTVPLLIATSTAALDARGLEELFCGSGATLGVKAFRHDLTTDALTGSYRRRAERL